MEHKERKTFVVNEYGNQIQMNIIIDDRGVTIYAEGPTSEVEHTWTVNEAIHLRDLLIRMELTRNKQFPNKYNNYQSKE